MEFNASYCIINENRGKPLFNVTFVQFFSFVITQKLDTSVVSLATHDNVSVCTPSQNNVSSYVNMFSFFVLESTYNSFFSGCTLSSSLLQPNKLAECNKCVPSISVSSPYLTYNNKNKEVFFFQLIITMLLFVLSLLCHLLSRILI